MKVREVKAVEAKSQQEIERELLEKHEAEVQAKEQGNTESATESVNPEGEKEVLTEEDVKDKPIIHKDTYSASSDEMLIGDEQVKAWLKEKYNSEFDDLDSLFNKEDVQSVDDDEVVEAFKVFRKETGRGIEDYFKLSRDFDSMDENTLLKEYYMSTEDDLDSEDVAYIINDKFSFDEELDSDSDIKKKKIEKKRELAKAKKYFNDLKEQYKQPIESKGQALSEEDKNILEAYKKQADYAEKAKESNVKRQELFQTKTNEVFNKDFKGFEFEIGDQKMHFSPGDVDQVRKSQSNIDNFISKFLDSDGFITDALGYHKALSFAMNPDKVAAFFYEKGKSDSIKENAQETKNMDFKVRSSAPSLGDKKSFSVRDVSQGGGRLKIR